MKKPEIDMTERACAECGKPHKRSYSKCAELDRMVRDCLCFNCAFWSVASERKHETVIDHFIYFPGNRISGEFRGMSGRRFDIEYLDGRRVTTFDLWGGGTVPEKHWTAIPDTARFIDGGERKQVAKITCFNPTMDPRAPLNPLPNGRLIKFGDNGHVQYA